MLNSTRIQFLQLLNKNSLVDVQLGDRIQKEMSVLFSDIRNFTTLSEKMAPEENFKFINSYLSRMESGIILHNGFIDKYIGDAIMALFNGCADDAVKALRCCKRWSMTIKVAQGQATYPFRLELALIPDL